MMKSMKVLKFLAAFCGLVLCTIELPNGDLNTVTAIIGLCLLLVPIWSIITAPEGEEVEIL